jgi:signal transduction histidine kinase/ligand-binding sensor domain-containing protein
MLSASTAPAQTVFSSRGEPYIFDQWTVNDGLPQNSVASIVQSSDGFIWLATNGGLVRFDGVRFVTFDRITPTDERAYRITSVVESHDSSLWIATEDGELFRYRDGRFKPMIHRAHGEPMPPILAMSMDSSGQVWIGRARLGLARVMSMPSGEDSVVQSWLQPGWPQSTVSIVQASPDGSLWIGGTGLAQLMGAGIRTYQLPRGGPEQIVTSLEIDETGEIWLTTSDGLVFTRRDQDLIEWPSSMFKDSYAFDEVLVDPPPVVRAARRSGLLRLTDGRFYRIGTTEWARGDIILESKRDNEGNWWLGTASNGLLRLRRAPFDHWTLDGSRRNVTAMVHDARRGTWIGLSCGGVLLAREGRIIPHPVSAVVADQCVWSLAIDRRGHLWVGTWGGGLLRMDPDQPAATLQKYGASSGIGSDVILALSPRRDGGMWVGTNTAGVVLLEGSRVRRWSLAEGLPSDDVRAVVEDSLGRVWVGTQRGPAVIEDGTVRPIGELTDAGIPVRNVTLDPSGAVWFGTYGGGLLRWKDGAVSRFTTDHGLFDNIVSQFLIDQIGYAWMGCNRGIWRVALQELNALADGRIERVISISYGTSDGLATVETNGGFQPAGLRLPNGELWFPTPMGIARTNPAMLRPNRAKPPVVIERIFADGEPVAVEPSILISSSIEKVRIDFTALSFTAPRKVRFKYQLVGYNKSWVDVAGDRYATFTNVTPGTYRFRVIAANNDGVWNEDGAEISLTFELPYWSTLWFRLLAVLALVGMGMLVVAIRLRQVRIEKERQEETSRRLIQSQEEERQRIAGELHDSLGQDLIVAKNRLLLAAHYLQEGTPAKEELMNVVDAVTAALRSVRSIAYNLRPFQLDRLGLTETIRSTVRAVQQVTPVKIETEIATVDGLLNRDAEIGVFRIIQEALTNVVKHSQATRASVVVAHDEGHIVVRVEDNGKGFEAPGDGVSADVGFGLSGIEERVKMLGGIHKFTSSVDGGTTIAARIPVEGNEPEPAPAP